jgi:glycosyltransferase involved in cell wall biosynthesis
METIINYSSVCIGCSEEVCEKLADLGHTNIQLQPSFIDVEAINFHTGRVEILKEALGISAEDFVWVVSGGATYMKGVDYILPILEYFHDQPIKIIWVGMVPDDGLLFYIKKVANQKFKGKLFFVGPQSEDYYNYLAIANGYLLLSREECLSLAVLEAAYLGKPIVGFDSGIALKFVKPGMGRIIESRKVEELVFNMQWLHENPKQDINQLTCAAEVYSLKQQLINFERLIGNL